MENNGKKDIHRRNCVTRRDSQACPHDYYEQNLILKRRMKLVGRIILNTIGLIFGNLPLRPGVGGAGPTEKYKSQKTGEGGGGK